MRLDDVANYKVLMVGDAIYDRYRFCEPLGRATKDSILSVRLEKEETYPGGVWASAAHLQDLCAQVDVWHGNNALVNTKYLGRYAQKIFSVHESRAVDSLPEVGDINAYDLVVVFDYGHGFLTAELRKRIAMEAKFLAVNAQTNSANYGFNRVNEKWPKADLCVVDEVEARLAAHDADSSIEDVMLKLPYRNIIVTMGAAGAIGYGGGRFHRGKALTDRPIDLLGAGDAVLSVIAPFAKAGYGMEDLVALGNIAGAIKVGIIGHKEHITKQLLEKYL